MCFLGSCTSYWHKILFLFFFFFKQKTAYEIGTGDWSSDVCSSDLASVEEIDELNILRAAHLAMQRAIDGLPHPPDYALIDGNMIPKGLTLASEAVIKGDGLSASIAAASIVAKIRRDRLMMDLAQQYPGYGWETNAGYGSKKHMDALANLGVTPHHRRSFKPVHNILYQAKSVTL